MCIRDQESAVIMTCIDAMMTIHYSIGFTRLHIISSDVLLLYDRVLFPENRASRFQPGRSSFACLKLLAHHPS